MPYPEHIQASFELYKNNVLVRFEAMLLNDLYVVEPLSEPEWLAIRVALMDMQLDLSPEALGVSRARLLSAQARDSSSRVEMEIKNGRYAILKQSISQIRTLQTFEDVERAINSYQSVIYNHSLLALARTVESFDERLLSGIFWQEEASLLSRADLSEEDEERYHEIQRVVVRANRSIRSDDKSKLEDLRRWKELYFTQSTRAKIDMIHGVSSSVDEKEEENPTLKEMTDCIASLLEYINTRSEKAEKRSTKETTERSTRRKVSITSKVLNIFLLAATMHHLALKQEKVLEADLSKNHKSVFDMLDWKKEYALKRLMTILPMKRDENFFKAVLPIFLEHDTNFGCYRDFYRRLVRVVSNYVDGSYSGSKTFTVQNNLHKMIGKIHPPSADDFLGGFPVYVRLRYMLNKQDSPFGDLDEMKGQYAPQIQLLNQLYKNMLRDDLSSREIEQRLYILVKLVSRLSSTLAVEDEFVRNEITRGLEQVFLELNLNHISYISMEDFDLDDNENSIVSALLDRMVFAHSLESWLTEELAKKQEKFNESVETTMKRGIPEKAQIVYQAVVDSLETQGSAKVESKSSSRASRMDDGRNVALHYLRDVVRIVVEKNLLGAADGTDGMTSEMLAFIHEASDAVKQCLKVHYLNSALELLRASRAQVLSSIFELLGLEESTVGDDNSNDAVTTAIHAIQQNFDKLAGTLTQLFASKTKLNSQFRKEATKKIKRSTVVESKRSSDSDDQARQQQRRSSILRCLVDTKDDSLAKPPSRVESVDSLSDLTASSKSDSVEETAVLVASRDHITDGAKLSRSSSSEGSSLSAAKTVQDSEVSAEEQSTGVSVSVSGATSSSKIPPPPPPPLPSLALTSSASAVTAPAKPTLSFLGDKRKGRGDNGGNFALKSVSATPSSSKASEARSVVLPGHNLGEEKRSLPRTDDQRSFLDEIKAGRKQGFSLKKTSPKQENVSSTARDNLLSQIRLGAALKKVPPLSKKKPSASGGGLFGALENLRNKMNPNLSDSSDSSGFSSDSDSGSKSSIRNGSGGN